LRLPNTAHSTRPWRIHEIAGDFGIEDVWELPTPGGPDDLDHLVLQLGGVGGDTAADDDKTSRVTNALMALRWRIGKLVSWDRPRFAVGEQTRSLRERLPDDLRRAPLQDLPGALFRPVYQTHDEWAGEYADRILHAVLHLGWVPDDSGNGYHGQMAILVKPTGMEGKAYMLGIRPFRWFLVYPALLRSMERTWQKPTAR
jgi:hypothetical protein